MRILVLLLSVFFVFSAVAELPPLKVDGRRLTADGKEVRLRGINWGWWHHGGTVYREEHMKQQAEWGANAVRLPISYTDVANSDGSWNEDRFGKVDEVVRWAKKHNQYVILDMHVCVGGQTCAHYVEGGRNQIWTDAEAQRRHIDLWREIARRYRGEPVVAAYELMNEPTTEAAGRQSLIDLNRRTVAAIREIDPAKIIVISDDNWGGTLLDGIEIADPNILYSVHFYHGDLFAWAGNLGENGEKLSGTKDWTKFQLPFEIPDDVRAVYLLLRSVQNSGQAWFDDIKLTDENGKVLYSASFDNGPGSFLVERSPVTVGAYDSKIGRSNPGSLSIRGTTDYNGWKGPQWELKPGKYRVEGWIRLENATGGTFIAAALFKKARNFSVEELLSKLQPSIDFSKNHNVPVLIGEFAVARGSRDGGYQADATEKRIQLFEDQGLNWTYWNYRETSGPNSMALQRQKRDGEDYPVNSELLRVLNEGWKRNLPRK